MLTLFVIKPRNLRLNTEPWWRTVWRYFAGPVSVFQHACTALRTVWRTTDTLALLPSAGDFLTSLWQICILRLLATTGINPGPKPTVTTNLHRSLKPTVTTNLHRSLKPTVTTNLHRSLKPTVTTNLHRSLKPTVTTNLHRSLKPTVTTNLHRSLKPTVTTNFHRSLKPNVTTNLHRSLKPTVTTNLHRSLKPTVTTNLHRSLKPTPTTNLHRSLPRHVLHDQRWKRKIPQNQRTNSEVFWVVTSRSCVDGYQRLHPEGRTPLGWTILGISTAVRTSDKPTSEVTAVTLSVTFSATHTPLPAIRDGACRTATPRARQARRKELFYRLQHDGAPLRSTARLLNGTAKRKSKRATREYWTHGLFKWPHDLNA
jgi:hypothetical protein